MRDPKSFGAGAWFCENGAEAYTKNSATAAVTCRGTGESCNRVIYCPDKMFRIIMRGFTVFILAGIACILVIAAGCTGTSGTAPVSTTAAATTVPAPAATTAAPAVPIASWAGTWDTLWGSGNTTTGIAGESITMTQTGSSVTGTYANGSISGTTAGNTLTGTWKENDGTGGPVEFVLSSDGSSFSGKWAYTSDPAGSLATSKNSWNGVKSTAQKNSWAGTWNTSWGSGTTTTGIAGERMTMTQTGSSVTGKYTNGSVSGTAAGNTLTGTWKENDGTGGPVEFILSSDGSSFSGKWAYTSDPAGSLATTNKTWNGVRV